MDDAIPISTDDLDLLVNEETDQLVAAMEAVTPDELRRVAESLATNIEAYDGSILLARAIVDKLLERADVLEAQPN